ncbi:hypothetical protein DYU11_18405 [Fibrisoma montanum]|uniref:DUF86 domain-containing protein n=2 Tax=Fibrisoma montanum TaxID=2305895 RepID=A0A418M607_9BACT|nr:hypothetical protein DYU11_18405 [Fibrisoma montanum]
MAAPLADQWPTLTDCLDLLQDVRLLADHPAFQASRNYHLHRSVDELTAGLHGLIARLDPEILQAVQYQPAHA